MAEMRRISTHKKTSSGLPVDSRSGQTKYAKRTVEGIGMYVFTHGKGSKKVSFTRHCSEKEAKKILEELNKK